MEASPASAYICRKHRGESCWHSEARSLKVRRCLTAKCTCSYTFSLSSPEFTSPAQIASGSRIATQIYRGNRATMDRLRSARGAIPHRMRSCCCLWVTHVGRRCYTFYDSVWKESRDYVPENCETIVEIGLLLGRYTYMPWLLRAQERETEKKKVQSAWKMTREIAMAIIPARGEIATYNGSD